MCTSNQHILLRPFSEAPKGGVVARGIHRLIGRLFSRKIFSNSRAKGNVCFAPGASCGHPGAWCDCGIYVLRRWQASPAVSEGRSPDPALDEREDRFKNLRQASPRAAVRKLSIQISRGAERSSGRRTTAVAAEVKDDYCLEYEPV